jgi:hypothetical protein
MLCRIESYCSIDLFCYYLLYSIERHICSIFLELHLAVLEVKEVSGARIWDLFVHISL